MIHFGTGTIVAAASLCGGPVMFARGLREMNLRRLIQNTPTARIRSLAMGLVEINGIAEPQSTITAPFSGRSCAFWEVEIAVPTKQKGWNTVYRDASGHPFRVDDGTGAALVYPTGAECHVPYTSDEECMGVSLPEVYATYLKEHGPAMRHLWQFGSMRFRERTIEVGQRVYVLGSAEPRSQ